MKSHASMNRIYRLVWNAALSIWVAVAENAKGRGKGGSSRSSVEVVSVNASGGGFSLNSACKAALTMLGAVALSSAFTAQSYAADAVNAAVSAGIGSVATIGTTTTINQTSQRLAIDWTKLSTASNEALVFAQPNGQAIALNRITGSSPSSFLGSLSANGQVFILNPNGMLFGAGSQVNVGGLVATTLAMSNADFMAGNNTFTKTTGTGSVVNQGSITATQGGYIALLAPEVRNEGVITATLGTALLAAGNKVTLNLNNGSLLGYSIDEGALNALADNNQLIQANGGQVILSAKAFDALSSATVNNTGIIEAKTLGSAAGRILLMGDMAVGTVNVAGRLDASAPNTGNGGFVETSAAKVKVADAAVVTTAAAHGLTGSWLIDPQDYTIAATGGDITGAALSSNLATNNITVQSTGGAVGTNGDIFVNDAVSWSTANSLTLNAQRNININQSITAQNAAGSLALLYGQGALAASNTAVYNVNAPVNLQAGNNFSTKLGSNGTVTAYTVITSLGAPGSTTKTDLQGMAGSLGTNYVLGSNIDASATGTGTGTGAGVVGWGAAGFAPVGNGTISFTGTFDGLGHSISNLTINLPTTNNVGLFGQTSGSSVIRNVGLVGGSVSGRSGVGGLVGFNYGSISNSYATGNASSSGGYSTGGLVGANYGSISNSYATGNASSSGSRYSSIGGLVGSSGSYGSSISSISNSYATGMVSGSGNNVGGLVGSSYGYSRSSSSSIRNSYATGVVSGSGNNVGGLVGGSYGNSSIINSYATGIVAGSSNFVGGLVGRSFMTSSGSTSVSNSYATGNVTGSGSGSGSGNYAGGLVGGNGGSINNSYATGSVVGRSAVGGLIGENTGNGISVSNSYATGSATGSTYVGGLIGNNYNNLGGPNVQNSYWNSDKNPTGISGGTTSGATGLSTTQMQQQISFASLDFINTWLIYGGFTNPLLRSVMTPLTVTANGAAKTYDGLAYSGGNGATYSSTPNANLLGALSYSGSAQGAVNTGSYGIVATGGLYSNQQGYIISYTGNAAVLTVNPATLTVAANTASRTYGAANPALSGNVSGFVNGEQQANVTTGVETFTTGATNTSNVGSYGVNGAGLTANNGNYVFTQAAGNGTALSVTPVALSVAANSDSKLADGTAYRGGNGVVYSGFVNAETAAVLAGSLKYGGSSQGASAAGSYTIAPSGLNASNYTLTYINGALTIKPGSVTTKPSSMAIAALGGTELVAAYESVLSQVSKPTFIDGTSDNADSDKAGKAGKTYNGNDNNKDKSGAASNNSMATLKGCGVAMPAGFDDGACK